MTERGMTEIARALKALRESLGSDHLTPYVESRIHIAILALERAFVSEVDRRAE